MTAARSASTSSGQSGSASATSTGFIRSDLSVLHVVAVKRLKEQHFVAGVEQRHGRGVKTGRRARRDQHLAVRVVVESVVALLLCRDGLAQPRDAVAARVDIVPVADGLIAASSTTAGTGVSHTPCARLMPPMRSHSVVMARISD